MLRNRATWFGLGLLLFGIFVRWVDNPHPFSDTGPGGVDLQDAFSVGDTPSSVLGNFSPDPVNPSLFSLDLSDSCSISGHYVVSVVDPSETDEAVMLVTLPDGATISDPYDAAMSLVPFADGLPGRAVRISLRAEEPKYAGSQTVEERLFFFSLAGYRWATPIGFGRCQYSFAYWPYNNKLAAAGGVALDASSSRAMAFAPDFRVSVSSPSLRISAIAPAPDSTRLSDATWRMTGTEIREFDVVVENVDVRFVVQVLEDLTYFGAGVLLGAVASVLGGGPLSARGSVVSQADPPERTRSPRTVGLRRKGTRRP